MSDPIYTDSLWVRSNPATDNQVAGRYPLLLPSEHTEITTYTKTLSTAVKELRRYIDRLVEVWTGTSKDIE